MCSSCKQSSRMKNFVPFYWETMIDFERTSVSKIEHTVENQIPNNFVYTLYCYIVSWRQLTQVKIDAWVNLKPKNIFKIFKFFKTSKNIQFRQKTSEPFIKVCLNPTMFFKLKSSRRILFSKKQGNKSYVAYSVYFLYQ